MTALSAGIPAAQTAGFGIRAGRYSTRIEASTVVIGTIAFAPVIWISGLSAFAYHLAAILVLVVLIASGQRPIRLGLTEALLLIYCNVYGMSLMINWNQHELERALASVYNLSVWCIAVVMVLVGRNAAYETSLRSLVRASTWLVLFVSIASGIGLLAWMSGIGTLSYTSLAGHVWSSDQPAVDSVNLLAANSRLTLVTEDWLLNSLLPRTTVLAPYPVALAGLLLSCLPLVLATIFRPGWPAPLRAVVGVLGLAALALTLSRMACIAIFCAWILVEAVARFGPMIVSMVSLLLVSLLFVPFEVVLESVFWLREGSTLSRIELYAFGVDLAANTAPMFGLGVKPRIPLFEIPVGSHSTYLGAFVKTGVIGAAAVIAIAVRIGFCALRAAATSYDRLTRALAVSAVAMLVWMSTEDIDAPVLVAFVFWFQVGLIEGALRRRTVGSV